MSKSATRVNEAKNLEEDSNFVPILYYYLTENYNENYSLFLHEEKSYFLFIKIKFTLKLRLN